MILAFYLRSLSYSPTKRIDPHENNHGTGKYINGGGNSHRYEVSF